MIGSGGRPFEHWESRFPFPPATMRDDSRAGAVQLSGALVAAWLAEPLGKACQI